MRSPAATTTSSAPSRHPPPPHSTAVLHGAPETEPHKLGFGFWPQAPPARVCECTAPPPPPLYLRHPTTIPLYPPLPFHTAYLKPSHISSVSGFRPQAPPPASVCERTAPPPTTTSSTPAHNIPPSPSAPVSYGMPETELSRKVSKFSALAPHKFYFIICFCFYSSLLC
jgi:hypothetical protein